MRFEIVQVAYGTFSPPAEFAAYPVWVMLGLFLVFAVIDRVVHSSSMKGPSVEVPAEVVGHVR